MFNGSTSNLGLERGVILSNGFIEDAKGPNQYEWTGGYNGGAGDVELEALAGGNTFDACILEFDIVPRCSELIIHYVFASEEYDEYVCRPFNDVFGFFISGPGIRGSENIATVPGTNEPVSINTVNNGNPSDPSCQPSNKDYYINNRGGQSHEFDGLTVPLTAKTKVTPCEKYHLKLAIADVGDGNLNSAVFLAKSGVNCPREYRLSGTDVVEGCNNGGFMLYRMGNAYTDDIFRLNATGTALPGTDYSSIDTSVLLPKGIDSVFIPVEAFSDVLSEGMETIQLCASSQNDCYGIDPVCHTIRIYESPINNIGVEDVSCYRSCNGSATVNLQISDGIRFRWSNGTTTQSANNLCPGNYTVTLSYGDNCIDIRSVRIKEPEPLNTTLEILQEVTCKGYHNGTLKASVSGGAPPYSIIWNTGSEDTVLAGLTTGFYQVSVTDANGCVKNRSIRLQEPDPLLFKSNIHYPLCYESTDGTIELIPENPQSEYYYLWNTGDTSSRLKDLKPGIYTVTIINTSNCTYTETFTLPNPPFLTIRSTEENSICKQPNGKAALFVTGGTKPYRYKWPRGQTTAAVSNLAAGNYKVSVTDDKGCLRTKIISISDSGKLTLTIDSIIRASCLEINDGAIYLSSSGKNVTYQWSSGHNTPAITGIYPGSYLVTATDENGCKAADHLSVPHDRFNLHTEVTHTRCDTNGGSAIMTVTGGRPDFNYTWSNGSTNDKATGLAPGRYTVTVTDSKGCKEKERVFILGGSSLSLEVSGPTTISCNGATDAWAQVIAYGGTGNYHYLWSTGDTTPIIRNLGPGTYYVGVWDEQCGVRDSITITEPAPINIIVRKRNAVCNDNNGFARLYFQGGAPPYDYSIFDKDSNLIVKESCNGEEDSCAHSNLKPNGYFVLATDAKGCAGYTLFNIIDEGAPEAQVDTIFHNRCFGDSAGKILLNTSDINTFTYLWSDGNNKKNNINLTSGTYTVTVTSYEGCQTIIEASVTEPLQLTVDATVDNIFCGKSQGAISVQASGGIPPYTYNWSHANNELKIKGPKINELISGKYTVKVDDSVKCSVSKNFAIEEKDPALILDSIKHVKCGNDKEGYLSVNINDGRSPFNFIWSNGMSRNSISGLQTGIYHVTATTSDNCMLIDTFEIKGTDPLSVRKLIQQPGCNLSNGKIFARAAGGIPPYSFSWSNGQTDSVALNLTSGIYTITVTDSLNCSKIDSAIVNDKDAPIIQTKEIVPNKCYNEKGGAISLSIKEGIAPYNYKWSNGAKDLSISGLKSGYYRLTVTGGNQCKTIRLFEVPDPDSLEVFVYRRDANCGASDGKVRINTSGGTPPYSYSWSDGLHDPEISGLKVGNYSLTVEDANGCNFQSNVLINNLGGPGIGIDSFKNVDCIELTRGKVSVSADRGVEPITYQWSTGATTKNIGDLTTGTYIVTVTSGNGCSSVEEIKVGANKGKLRFEAFTKDDTCGKGNGSIGLTVPGNTNNYHFNWGMGEINSDKLYSLHKGEYPVTIRHSNGCTVDTSIEVKGYKALQLETFNTNTCSNLCDGEIKASVSGGLPPYTFYWIGMAATRDSMMENLCPGSYRISVLDANKCTAEKEEKIEVLDKYKTGYKTYFLCRGDSMKIRPKTQGNFTWSPPAGLSDENIPNPTIRPEQTTTYFVNIADTNGCYRKDTIVVKMQGEGERYTLNMPNAFTPNDDGHNDLFMGVGRFTGIVEYKMQIWSRWGELIFETHDLNQAWNGRKNNHGDYVKDGAYVYITQVKDMCSLKTSNWDRKTGWVMVIKGDE